MGIRIRKYLLENIPLQKGIDRKHLSAYEGKRIVIDFFNIGSRILHRSDTLTKFTYELINLVHKFAREGIKMIFVFDGRPRSEKSNVIQHRRNLRNKITKKIEDIIDTLIEGDRNIKEECSRITFQIEGMIDTSFETDSSIQEECDKINALSKKTRSIRPIHVEEAKGLFDVLGVHYVHLEDIEADIILKYMLESNLADACFTGDMDALAYGCKLVLQDLDFKNDTVNELDYSKLLQSLDVTHDEFLHAMVLSGTDWNNSLKKSNFEINLKLIKKYGSIPIVLDHLDEINNGITEDDKFAIPSRFNWQDSLEIFNEPIIPEVIEKIRHILVEQSNKFAKMKSPVGYNIINKFYEIIFNSDKSYKYVRKVEEYLFWRYAYKIPHKPNLTKRNLPCK
jgi:5'-3' exonuclease